jgi:hypothetical protein
VQYVANVLITECFTYFQASLYTQYILTQNFTWDIVLVSSMNMTLLSNRKKRWDLLKFSSSRIISLESKWIKWPEGILRFCYSQLMECKHHSSRAALNQLWRSSFASLLEPSKPASRKSRWDRKRWRRKGALQVPWLTVLLFPIHEHCSINQTYFSPISPQFLTMLITE